MIHQSDRFAIFYLIIKNLSRRKPQCQVLAIGADCQAAQPGIAPFSGKGKVIPFIKIWVVTSSMQITGVIFPEPDEYLIFCSGKRNFFHMGGNGIIGRFSLECIYHFQIGDNNPFFPVKNGVHFNKTRNNPTAIGTYSKLFLA